MPAEIERKFLVAGDGWNAAAKGSSVIRQAYLAATDKTSVRARIKDETEAFLTIKSAESGHSRREYEYPIPVADARELMALRIGRLIEKRRYIVPAGALRWEIDVFSGDHQGLIIAEIELPDADASFERPDWLGKEVTGDLRYYNVSLALNGTRSER
jgi:adenylate cyclase